MADEASDGTMELVHCSFHQALGRCFLQPQLEPNVDAVFLILRCTQAPTYIFGGESHGPATWSHSELRKILYHYL